MFGKKLLVLQSEISSPVKCLYNADVGVGIHASRQCLHQEDQDFAEVSQLAFYVM